MHQRMTAAFIGGHLGVAIGLPLGIAAFLAALGRLSYDVPIPLPTLPTFVLTVLVGAIAFACLGFALTVLVRNGKDASPLGLSLTLTLFFLSGNFIVMPEEVWPTAT